MEAAPTSETSVDNYFTRQYIPEDKSEQHMPSIYTRLKSPGLEHRDKRNYTVVQLDSLREKCYRFIRNAGNLHVYRERTQKSILDSKFP
jgi:hypothetical protein